MKVRRLSKAILAGLVLSFAFVPSPELFGDDVKPATPGTPALKIEDVALDPYGHLHGTFVDPVGLPLVGNRVTARQGKGKVHSTQTDAKGSFELTGLKGGVWSISVGSQSSLVRAWTHQTAPPAAKSRLMLIKQASVIRGQSGDGSMLSAFDAGTLFSIGAGMAGVTLGVIGISEAEEANDEANAANDQAAALRAELNALSATLDELILTLN